MDCEKKTDYKYILDIFGKEVVAGRCNWLKEAMDSYLKQETLENSVVVSESILFHVIIDYFVDISRLKEFHNIDKTNAKKIYAYTVYWVLRHKPLQIIGELSEEYVFINELFCAELLRSFLFDNPSNVPIRQESLESINEFISTMSYFFKYRDYTAKTIELMLIAFDAGRGYQFSVDHQR